MPVQPRRAERQLLRQQRELHMASFQVQVQMVLPEVLEEQTLAQMVTMEGRLLFQVQTFFSLLLIPFLLSEHQEQEEQGQEQPMVEAVAVDVALLQLMVMSMLSITKARHLAELAATGPWAAQEQLLELPVEVVLEEMPEHSLQADEEGPVAVVVVAGAADLLEEPVAMAVRVLRDRMVFW